MKKVLFSLGAAMAARKIANAISGIEVDDVLGRVGLARRRSHFLENLGLMTAGALVGAGAALLLAPESGRETRKRLSSEASRLGNAAAETFREQKEEAMRSFSQVANGAVSSEHRS